MRAHRRGRPVATGNDEHEPTQTIAMVVNGNSKKAAHETFYLDSYGNSPDALGFSKNRSVGTILNDD